MIYLREKTQIGMRAKPAPMMMARIVPASTIRFV